MKELTRMCDAAPELKRTWRARVGDRVYFKYDLYEKDGNWTLIKSGEPPIFHEGQYFLKAEDPPEIKNFVIWIPHIEQLINLLLGKYGILSPLMTDFGRFIYRKEGEIRPIDTYDFNALWLLFYMFQIHSKVWDGEQFHKIKTNIWGEIVEDT